MTSMSGWRKPLFALLLTTAVGHAAEPAATPLPAPVTPASTVAQTSGLISATTPTDAQRLARDEAELAELKREKAYEQVRTKWWEYGCMGCLGATTILVILLGLFL